MGQDYLKTVKPSEISAEFEKIRRNSSSEKKNNTVRATLANVIFLLDDNKNVTSLIQKLAKNLPSRFFTIKIEEKLESPISTSVGTFTVENSSGQLLETEEIQITSTPEAVNRIPNLILSQLVPDVDIVLIDTDSNCTNQNLQSLKELLIPITDLYLTKEISADTFSTVKLFNSGNTKTATRCWSVPLISKWRLLVSEQFNSDYVLSSLKSLNCIEIKCTAKAPTDAKVKTINDSYLSCLPADVNLLISWIQNSLGLKISSLKKLDDGSIEVEYDSTTKQFLSAIKLKISFLDQESEGFSSKIKEISFKMGEESHAYQVDCKYLSKLDVIEISTGGTLKKEDTGADICEFNVRRIPAQNIDEADAILTAIRNQPVNCNL